MMRPTALIFILAMAFAAQAQASDLPIASNIISSAVIRNAGPLETKINGFHNISERQYYISDEIVMPWVQAAKYCNLLDMKLVSLETQLENLDVVDYIRANVTGFSSFWTSGHKIEDTWFWTGSGQVFTFTEWMQGSPNNEGSPCVFMYIGSEISFWDDYDCQSMFHFMCEE